jgi:hypothetical protein
VRAQVLALAQEVLLQPELAQVLAQAAVCRQEQAAAVLQRPAQAAPVHGEQQLCGVHVASCARDACEPCASYASVPKHLHKQWLGLRRGRQSSPQLLPFSQRKTLGVHTYGFSLSYFGDSFHQQFQELAREIVNLLKSQRITG